MQRQTKLKIYVKDNKVFLSQLLHSKNRILRRKKDPCSRKKVLFPVLQEKQSYQEIISLAN